MKIYGPKVEVTGGWRKLHSEELQNLYFSPTIVKMMGEYGSVVG
jgi:hypothetical protein